MTNQSGTENREAGTWEGSRREQLRRWKRMSLREKLQAMDDMLALSRRLSGSRRVTSGDQPDTSGGDAQRDSDE